MAEEIQRPERIVCTTTIDNNWYDVKLSTYEVEKQFIKKRADVYGPFSQINSDRGGNVFSCVLYSAFSSP